MNFWLTVFAASSKVFGFGSALVASGFFSGFLSGFFDLSGFDPFCPFFVGLAGSKVAEE